MSTAQAKEEGGRVITGLYKYHWGNNAKRKTLKGRLCKIVAHMAMNSVVVEFQDNGQQEVVSRRALRKEPEITA